MSSSDDSSSESSSSGGSSSSSEDEVEQVSVVWMKHAVKMLPFRANSVTRALVINIGAA